MTSEQMEQRFAAIESRLEGMGHKLDRMTGGPNPKSRWWESLPALPPPTPDEAAVRAYIRQTGEAPPAGWAPGDPIPEPDWWN